MQSSPITDERLSANSATSATEARSRTVHKSKKPWWRSLPSAGFLRDPWYCIKYELGWIAGLAAACGLLWASGWGGVPIEWSPWVLLLLIPGCYIVITSHLFVHNATHKSFPPAINRLAGEFFGVIAGTRFAPWEILHRRHHLYSDHREKDPHPAHRSYWKFLIAELLNLEKNMHEQYYELWGDTPAHRRRRMFKTLLNGTAGGVLLLFWYLLLGPVLFFAVFLPASVIGVLHVSHFNWFTHNASVSDDFRPVNNDHGIWWLGNRMFFGIYMHANHHAYPSAFNPLNIPEERAAKVEETLARMAAKVHRDDSAAA